MVPDKIEEIGPALARALETMDAQLARDLKSVAADREAARATSGTAALDAVREAADALKARLADEPREEPNRSPE